MKICKKINRIVWAICFISGLMLISCSESRKAYYIGANNDTIAYLANKDWMSKTARIEIYKNHLLKRDSLHRCLYNYYKLDGYKTLVTVTIGEEIKAVFKFLLNEDSSEKASCNMSFGEPYEVETAKRYYQKDSVELQEIISLFGTDKCIVFQDAIQGNTDFYPEDYYAMCGNDGLMIFKKNFKEDTLRILNYAPKYVKKLNDDLSRNPSWGKSIILKSAKNIKYLSDVAKGSINKDEFMEDAQLTLISLNRHHITIFISLKILYQDILEKELEKYQLDKLEFGYIADKKKHVIESVLYMTADIFKNERTCTKIFNNIEKDLYLLGARSVIFKWGQKEEESRTMRVSPESLDDLK